MLCNKAFPIIALMMASIAFAGCAVAMSNPDLVLSGEITRADYQKYKLVPFNVPAGTRRVTVDFAYDTRERKTTIDIGLFDIHGLRGWAGGDKSSFTVSDVDATPAFSPGLIEPGEWRLVLGVPNIREGVTAHYTARIVFSKSLDSRPETTSGTRHWYKGDLHMHTGNSDGYCKSSAGEKAPCPLYKTAEAARARGLDFISITDHNTVAHHNELARLQSHFAPMLLIPGREITTFYGHANLFGTSEWLDFRTLDPAQSRNLMLANAAKLNAVLSVNHPAAPSGEICMGCGWVEPEQTNWNNVQAIEVVNGPEIESQFSGIRYWEKLLNQGHRITAVGGSDNHQADIPPDQPRAIGSPTTMVYAESLSTIAILNAVRAGRVFIKTQGPDGPDVEFSAECNSRHFEMGDVITERAAPVQFSIAVRAGMPVSAELVKDGQVEKLELKNGVGGYHLVNDGQRHWLRINVRDKNGKLIALTNPIYLNFGRAE
jgi:hypothetical protein